MLGSTSISKLYLGSTEVSKAYLGSTEVYSSQEFLLDTYGSAEFAYSFRELTANRSAFTSTGDTGSQTSGVWTVQIRRSSDSYQKSFTSEEITDGTLTTWVGAGNDGFVSRWYDQSGNSNDGYQSTSTRQPCLVVSGSLYTENGVPAMVADATSDKWLQLSSAYLGDFSVFSSYRALYDDCSLIKHLGGASAHAAGSRGGNGHYFHQTNNGTYDTGVDHPTTSVVSNFQMVGLAQSIHSNNSLIGSTTAAATNTANIGRVFYCRNQDAIGTSMTEFILYSSDKSTDRSNIFNNINTYYGAY